MAKTKTRDEVMSEAYWTPKEKEDLSSRYSTSLIKENCNQEEMKDKSLPSDAYIVTYKIGDAVRNDLVRCHGKVNIFDMYYDKFGAGSIVSIEYAWNCKSKDMGFTSTKQTKEKSEEKLMKEEQLRNQINDIIEGEIQLGINEFLEEKQRKESDQGLGFVTSEEAKKLKVKVFKDEVDKIMKQYKKIKKKEKSNISQVKKLGLVDKHGRPLNG